MAYAASAGRHRYVFDDLRALLARASPDRSGDRLAGLAADTEEERVAARMALADAPLSRFLDEPVVAYETDEVTRLILDSHDAAAFAPVASLTVGAFRDWLLSDAATAEALAETRAGADARNGGRGLQADAQPGPDRGCRQDPSRHAIPQHHRAAWPPLRPPAAQPSDRRSEGHRRHPSSTACCTAAAMR